MKLKKLKKEKKKGQTVEKQRPDFRVQIPYYFQKERCYIIFNIIYHILFILYMYIIYIIYTLYTYNIYFYIYRIKSYTAFFRKAK